MGCVACLATPATAASLHQGYLVGAAMKEPAAAQGLHLNLSRQKHAAAVAAPLPRCLSRFQVGFVALGEATAGLQQVCCRSGAAEGKRLTALHELPGPDSLGGWPFWDSVLRNPTQLKLPQLKLAAKHLNVMVREYVAGEIENEVGVGGWCMLIMNAVHGGTCSFVVLQHGLVDDLYHTQTHLPERALSAVAGLQHT